MGRTLPRNDTLTPQDNIKISMINEMDALNI